MHVSHNFLYLCMYPVLLYVTDDIYNYITMYNNYNYIGMMCMCHMDVIVPKIEPWCQHGHGQDHRQDNLMSMAMGKIMPWAWARSWPDLGRHNLGTWARHLPKIFSDLAQDLAKSSPKILGQEPWACPRFLAKNFLLGFHCLVVHSLPPASSWVPNSRTDSGARLL